MDNWQSAGQILTRSKIADPNFRDISILHSLWGGQWVSRSCYGVSIPLVTIVLSVYCKDQLLIKKQLEQLLTIYKCDWTSPDWPSVGPACTLSTLSSVVSPIAWPLLSSFRWQVITNWQSCQSSQQCSSHFIFHPDNVALTDMTLEHIMTHDIFMTNMTWK